MRNDPAEFTTTAPPPAGPDVHAAETIIHQAPVAVLATLKAPAAAAAEPEDEDTDTLVFGPGASSSLFRAWLRPGLLTIVVCTLMFLLGRLL